MLEVLGHIYTCPKMVRHFFPIHAGLKTRREFIIEAGLSEWLWSSTQDRM